MTEIALRTSIKSLICCSMHKNIHKHITSPDSSVELVKGDYTYYHYGCDKINDQGWGCGYRSFQSICSWIKNETGSGTEVPSIESVQDALVQMGDKPGSFSGSREWIGSFEVAICIDHFYDIPCKIVHVRSGELSSHLSEIEDHFKQFGSPVMMGGDSDNASKCILGVSVPSESLLIMDPHCYENEPNIQHLIEKGLIKWRPLSSFMESSFYNLCLPQLKGKS